jgi:hypothetical protein
MSYPRLNSRVGLYPPHHLVISEKYLINEVLYCYKTPLDHKTLKKIEAGKNLGKRQKKVKQFLDCNCRRIDDTTWDWYGYID